MSIVGGAFRWHGCTADHGSVDHGLVEVLVVLQHPRRISWTTFGRIFDEEEQRGERGVAGAGIILNPTHFLSFFLCRLLQDSRSSFRPLNDTTDARPSCACYPSYSSSAGRVYDCSLSSIAISTNPPGKSTRMTLTWRRIAL